MKNLTSLILLPVLLISFSCKKKESRPLKLASKGDFLILVVSDSLECALEYRKNTYPSSSGLKETPVTATAEFSNGDYDVSIYAYGVGIYGTYVLSLNGGWHAVDFPQFFVYYSENFVGSTPGKELYRHPAYHIPLDTSKVDFIMNSNIPGELEYGWSKIQDLRIVYEYRKRYPHSNVGFLCVKKENGETKRYFFMNKYKP